MKRISKITLTLFLICLLAVSTTNIKAEETKNQSVDFSIETIQPDNQEIKEVPYFHIYHNERIEQTLKVKIFNHTDKEITVKATLGNAFTSANGLIIYQESNKVHPSLKIPFLDVAKLKNNEINIAANDIGIAEIAIDADPINKEGIILGGINFAIINEEEVAGIGHEYEYNVAVVLASKEGALHSSKSLDLESLETKVENGQKLTIINLLNEEAQILSKLSVSVEIYDEKGNLVLENVSNNLSVAPNSILPFAMNWGIEDLKAGKYTAKINASSFDEKWQWEKSFEIENTEAASMNQETINKYYLSDLTIYSAISLGIITLINYLLTINTYRKEKVK